jgi:hypothetical protein
MNPSVVTRKIKLLRLGQTAALVAGTVVTNLVDTKMTVGCRVGFFGVKNVHKKI